MAPRFIILFNGPPRTGKDTASEYLIQQLHSSVILKFTEPVKNMTHERLDLNVPHYHYETLKDTPLSEFEGLTPREAYIETSRKLRQEKGNNAVAKLFVESVMNSNEEIVINPDIGYDFEAEELFNAFDVNKVLLFKINRVDKTFENDCRTWLTVDKKYPELKTVFVDNDDKSVFLDSVLENVYGFINSHNNDMIY